MALPARRGTTRILPVYVTPAHMIANIFVLKGDINGQGWKKGSEGRRGRIQDTEGRQMWG